MILRQYLDTDPVVAISYLVGCGSRGTAAVVDPIGDPDRYLRASEKTGMAITYVIDTHLHADHLSSGLELARTAGAEYALHETAGATYDFRALRDGERLALGNVLLEVLHVPGHTPEHLALLVADRARAAAPWLVFSGHTLMVGDMGRTELATTAEEGASALFESAERLRTLPDYVAVLPGAFSGSVCGRGLSGNPTSTIGFERRFNRAFSLTNRDDFLAYMMRDTPPRPPDAERNRAENLGLGVGHSV
jgi:hydroxyacylglutathione hydrolase